MAEDPGPPAPAPREALGLLTDRVFGPFFFAKQVGSAAMWANNVVAAIIAFDLTGSTFVVGLVTVAQWSPQLLLAPLSGAMADRGNRRLQLVLGWSISAAASGALALWIHVVGVAHSSVAPAVIIASLGTGIGLVIGVPAMQALLPQLVRPGELAPAVALNSVPMALGRALGPALGAGVLASGGPVMAFTMAAVGNGLFALVVLFVPVTVQRVPDTGDPSIRAGLRYVRRDPVIPLLLAATAAVAIGGEPSMTLTPALAAAFGRGADVVGLFSSAFGVGAGLSLLLIGVIRRALGLSAMGTTGLTALALSSLIAVVAPSVAVATAAFALAGAGTMVALTSVTTQLQERLPDGLRGRIMALWAVAVVGSRPVAAALMGVIADTVSLDAAFLVVALIVAVVTVWARPSRLRRHDPLLAPDATR